MRRDQSTWALWVVVALSGPTFIGCGANGSDGDAALGVAEEGLRKGTPGALNGQGDYCDSPTNPCTDGEGDCDANYQCTGAGIVCGARNGTRYGFHWSTDVCWPSSCQNGTLDPGEVTIDNGGPCGCTLADHYYDYDRDSWGRVSATPNRYCTGAAPAGWVTATGDCDDTNVARNPGAAEICGDSADQNCNGEPSEGCTNTTWCLDNDADTYPRSTGCVTQYARPAYNWLGTTAGTVYDCNDANAAINPAAAEACNGVDDNCDATVDEGARATYYLDNDRDSYPRSTGPVQSCAPPASNWVVDGSFSGFDCNDTNATINPGVAEVCGDSIDNDCSGAADGVGCLPAHCASGTQDGNETGVDCGGFCDVCTPGAAPTSCLTLPDTCGASGMVDCCTTNTVFGADYSRSYDAVGFTDDSNTATVYSYQLDVYEVTVARFREFVRAYDSWRGAGNPTAGAAVHPLITGTGWDATWTASLPADAPALETALGSCTSYFPTYSSMDGVNDTLPITCVTWYEAFAFCAWDGGRLPTEAEWNLAAAGGAEQRVYPWSEPATDTTITAQEAAFGCWYDGDFSSCTFADIADVGAPAAGVGRWGHYDLGGNGWEWTLDWYNATYPNPCVNCANMTPATWRVIRGGAYTSGADNSRASVRQIYAQNGRIGNVGFRCARGQ